MSAGFQRHGQVLIFQGGCTQIHQRASSLGQAVASHAPRQFQGAAGGAGIRGHAHLDNVQLGSDADEALSKRVMNFPRQPGPLLQYKGEAGADLPFPQPVKHPDHRREGRGT